MAATRPATAVLLSAGLGQRLAPLSWQRPKPLFPVLNQTQLSFWLDRLAEAGVELVVVNVHHLAEAMLGALAGETGRRPGLTIVPSVEAPAILGTGGALKRAGRLLGESFYSVNVDIMADIDLLALAAAHERLGRPPATLAVVDEPERATVSLDARGRIIGFRAKERLPGEAARLCGAGIMVVERSVLPLVPEGPSDVVETLASLLGGESPPAAQIFAGAFWRDMGRLDDYFDLNRRLARGRAFWGEPLVPAGGGASPPSALSQARIEGFLCAEPGAEVRPGAFLKDCVLWREAVVGAGAVVEGAVVAGPVPAGAVVRGGAVPGNLPPWEEP